MLIVSSVCAFTLISIGSDTTNAAFGISNDDAPLNVTFCSVLVSIALLPVAPLDGRAMVTAVMGSVVGPNAFEMRRRIREDGWVT